MTLDTNSFPGHAGRPGQVGGSVSAKAPGSVSVEDAIAKVDKMDAERQWGKLPTSELFSSSIKREDAGNLDQLAQGKKELKIIPFSGLIATQKGVDTDIVKDYIRSGDFSTSRGGSDAPVIVRLNKKDYVVDGHTRIVAAMMLGKKEMPMNFIDGDNMKNNMEIYAALNEHYTITEKTHQGRKHLVVPVVMMREGVHNGSHGAIFHPIDELGHFEAAWNGIPVSIQHPSIDGKHVSANSPDIIDANVVGKVFNTHVEGDKLKAEAWLDKERLKQISPATASYLKKGQPIEVSLGMFTDDEAGDGTWNGETYTATARNHRPDHLALLPGGRGACSWSDGCGIRANEEEGGDSGVNLENNSYPGHAGRPGQVGGSAPSKSPGGGSGKESKVGTMCKKSELSSLKKSTGADSVSQGTWKQHENSYYGKFTSSQFDFHFSNKKTGKEVASAIAPAVQVLKSKYKNALEVSPSSTIVRSNGKSMGTVTVMYRGHHDLVNSNNLEHNEQGGQTMADENKGCCPEKVEMLIQDENSKFVEADREWLLTQSEEVIEKLQPVIVEKEVIKEVIKEVSVNKEVGPTKEQVVQVLEESFSDQEKFLALLPAALRDQMESGLRLHQEKRDSLITHVMTNQASPVWTKEDLEPMASAQLQKIADSIPGKMNYRAAGGSHVNTNADNGEKLLPPGVK